MGFDEAWERTQKLTGWKKLAMFARFLDITPQSIYGARDRDAFPVDWAHKLALEYNSTTEWIVVGKGPMSLEEVIPRGPAEAYRSKEDLGWDRNLMIELIEKVETVLNEMNETILPDEKARMYAKLYELYREEEAAVDENELRRHLRLIV